MKVKPELIIEVCESSLTMSEAHRKLGQLKFDTFAKYAKQLGCYKPNPGMKGGSRPNQKKDILCFIKDEHPITSHKLKLRLIEAKIKEHKCEYCGIIEWNGKPTPIELDHIDGNHHNNKLENLRILCPNCHAQTDTYSGKKNKMPK